MAAPGAAVAVVEVAAMDTPPFIGWQWPDQKCRLPGDKCCCTSAANGPAGRCTKIYSTCHFVRHDCFDFKYFCLCCGSWPPNTLCKLQTLLHAGHECVLTMGKALTPPMTQVGELMMMFACVMMGEYYDKYKQLVQVIGEECPQEMATSFAELLKTTAEELCDLWDAFHDMAYFCLAPHHYFFTFICIIGSFMLMANGCCFPFCTCGVDGKPGLVNQWCHWVLVLLGFLCSLVALLSVLDFLYKLYNLFGGFPDMPDGDDDDDDSDRDDGDSDNSDDSNPDGKYINYIIFCMVFTLILRCQGCICGGCHIFKKACLIPPAAAQE